MNDYNPQRAIVIAAGQGRRWNAHLGDTKHGITVDGETLLQRTVRLLGQHQVETFLVIPQDARYEVPGAHYFYPDTTESIGDADKFFSSRDLWNPYGRTIILYGDVFFTDEAMTEIVGFPHPDWHLFGRMGGSRFTGKNHGECFAISFYHDFIPEFSAALRRVIDLYTKGLIDRNGGWEVYKAMIRLPDDVFATHPHPLAGPRFIQIDDFTDDFDWPSDYDEWIKRWNARET